MIDLEGKVVLVTGGARGIGAALSKTLLEAGAQVVVHYGRSRAAAESLVDAYGGERCLALTADLSEASAPAELWRRACGWQGRIDALVNNAGVARFAGVEADLAAWHRAWSETLQVNLQALADLCRESLLHLEQRGGGIIVNIASRAAFRGDSPDLLHYAASKGGVVSLTRSIARGWGGKNVTAFTVAPGFVRTDMAEEAVRAYGEEFIVSDIALGELTEPQEVANVVAFLVSGLARHATGSTIDVNGGSYVH